MMALEAERFFYRTGRRTGASLAPIAGATLRPALFAQVADLRGLRYDYPVVLVDGHGERWIEPLSSVLDVLLAEVAPAGSAGERFRRTVLRLEREIRVLVAGDDADLAVAARGATPSGGDVTVASATLWSLAELWTRAAERLVLAGGEPVAAELARARSALETRGLLEGRLADCDASLANNVVGHAWARVEGRKAARMLDRIEALRLALANLVRADFMRSEAGRGAEALAAGVGAAHRDLFDFGVMASLLAAPSGATALPPARRQRIQATIDDLDAQEFFGPGALPHRFERVDDALTAWRERQPAMARLVRAIAIAELELSGRYLEDRHDEYFADFGPASVTDEERGLFPGYLVMAPVGSTNPAGRALLLEALASDAPIKIVLQTDEPFGLGGQLATTAMGLGTAYVLQTPSAHLYPVRDHVQAALEFRGPALVSVFGGVFADRVQGGPGDAASLPPYLVAEAALESRVFPAFAYDPAAGPGWKERFDLLGNPQPERPWPIHELAYSDARLAHVAETVAFTPLDFAICDPARRGHFARTPVDDWPGLVPGGDWLDGAAGSGAAPYVPAVDEHGGLVRLAADDGLVREARRVLEAWNRLLQLDDLKRERVVIVEAPTAPVSGSPANGSGAVADAPAVALAPAAAASGAGTPAGSLAADSAAPVEAAEPERNPDEPYIETWRCTTCNECTNVNARMFAYNENRQAYIKDLSAGTYRDLVEAAESCQVAIIHPGKPRDPNEPGLEELVERAQPFL